MAGRGTGPDFVEALARGLDVLCVFEAHRGAMSLSEVAAETGLARPTARRLLLTLEELGYDVSYFEEIEGGHGASVTNEQLAHRLALSYTHLWNRLGKR